MSVDYTRLRAAARRAPGHADDMTRFERAALAEGAVMGIDPTLTATGWSVLTHTETELAVAEHDTVRWTHGVSTIDDQQAAGDALFASLADRMRELQQRYPGIEVVVEAPPTGNNKASLGKGRPESAQQAARVARDAALAMGLPLRRSVNIVHHKTLITGNRGADKNEVELHLRLLVQALPITGYPARTNDNVRDSICVALTDLHDREST